MLLEARPFIADASSVSIDIIDVEETSISVDENKFYLNIRIEGRHWYECVKTFDSEIALKSFVGYINALKVLMKDGLLGIEYQDAREVIALYKGK